MKYSYRLTRHPAIKNYKRLVDGEITREEWAALPPEEIHKITEYYDAEGTLIHTHQEGLQSGLLQRLRAWWAAQKQKRNSVPDNPQGNRDGFVL